MTTTDNMSWLTAAEDPIWHDIPNFEGLYQITRSARVRSLDRIVVRDNRFGPTEHHLRGRLLRNFQRPDGGRQIVLYDHQHRRQCVSISRLLADTFGAEVAA